MASFIRPWIADLITQHDASHGADLSRRITRPALCQLVKFTSVRTTSQPARLVRAIVSDRTHRVAVAFEPSAADSYEQSRAGEDPERVTGCLRAVLRLQEYSIGLVARSPPQGKGPPPAGDVPHARLPRIQLLIHRWDVVTGDRNDPVYFPDTREIGSGRTAQDGEVNRVLRKWWLGDSQKSQPSPVAKVVCKEEGVRENAPARKKTAVQAENMTRNAVAGPSRARQTPCASPPRRAIERAALKLVNKLVTDHAAKGQALPAWLFGPPSETQRAELEEITVFGVDVQAAPSPAAPSPAGPTPAATPATPTPGPVPSAETAALVSSLESNGTPLGPNRHSQSLSNGHTDSLSNGHTYPPTESPRAQPPEPLDPSSPGASQYESAAHPPPSSSPSAAIRRSPAAGRFQTPHYDSDDSDSIPIRLPRQTQAPRRQVFRSSPARCSSQPTGETDDEDLSDYERARRAQAPQRAAPSHASHPASQPSQPHASQPVISEESVSRSQDSGSFDLARLPRSAPLPSSPLPASAPQVSSSAPPAVLVPTTTDESMPTEVAEATEIHPSPPDPAAPPPATTPTMPAVAVPRKRPRDSDATTTSADADDEASLERPAKRATTGTATAATQANAGRADAGAEADADAEEYGPEEFGAHPDLTTPVKSSWEPPPGQRVPSTVGRPRPPGPGLVSVAEAVRQVLPEYTLDLGRLAVPGLSRELVEAVRAKAVEEKAARGNRRASGR